MGAVLPHMHGRHAAARTLHRSMSLRPDVCGGSFEPALVVSWGNPTLKRWRLPPGLRFETCVLCSMLRPRITRVLKACEGWC